MSKQHELARAGAGWGVPLMSVDAISEGGRFAVLAIDHRDSMRAVLAPGDADSVDGGAITDAATS